MLQPFIVKTVVSVSCDYDMVQECYVQQACCITEKSGLPAVQFTGTGVPGGVVVDQDYCTCQLVHSLADNQSWIQDCTADSAYTYFLFGDDLVGFVEEDHPAFLMLQIAQQG